MSAWLRLTTVLTGMELRRLFRSQEVYRYCLIPATFGVSVVMAASVLIVSALAAPTRTIAVPHALPGDLPLAEALIDEGFEILEADDPRALFDAGEVEAAIERWEVGDGIHAARRVGHGTAWRWQMRAWVQSRGDEHALEEAAKQAVEWALDERIVIAGGDPDMVLAPATVTVIELELEEPRRTPVQTRAFGRAFPMFILVSLAFFLHATGGLGDRRSGVTESLLTTPAPTTSLLLARTASTLAIQLLSIALIVANMAVFLGVWAFTENLRQGWQAALTVLPMLFLADVLLLALTLFAPDVRAALNWGGAAMAGVFAALFPGLLTEVPAWVPLAGGLHAEGPWIAVSAAVHLLLGAGVLWGASAMLDRYPSHKAGGGERGG